MARRRKPKHKGKPQAPKRKPAAALKARAHHSDCFPWILLALVTLLVYANAWPDTLVFDDCEFLAAFLRHVAAVLLVFGFVRTTRLWMVMRSAL